MATLTAQNIVDRAGVILQDTSNNRWAESELLDWLNDGQRQIVQFKPDANTSNSSVTLDSGAKQTLPSDAHSLIEVRRNMGSDGSTPGPAVTPVSLRTLDLQRPAWTADDQVAEIKHYAFNDQDPDTFYVYPPADGTSQVELVYSVIPSDITLSDSITVGDDYANALLNYILYRAYSKDADYAANNERAQGAYQAFVQALGIMQSQGE